MHHSVTQCPTPITPSRHRAQCQEGTDWITGWGEHYGVDPLLARVVRDARDEVDRKARARYAAKIRTQRLQSGMSMREFARLAGTSASRLSNYENANVAPTTDVLGRLEYVASIHSGARRSARRPDSAANEGPQRGQDLLV
jgi:ribosome-binding protein aMBF1 (putative translation factor)